MILILAMKPVGNDHLFLIERAEQLKHLNLLSLFLFLPHFSLSLSLDCFFNVQSITFVITVPVTTKIQRPNPIPILQVGHCFLPGVSAVADAVQAHHVRSVHRPLHRSREP